MTVRQEKILNKIVREYIRTARPVGSAFLEKKHGLGLCPATIRNEMKALAEEGYLSKLHTSSGRVPTSKGYRFFVDKFLSESSSIINDISEKGKHSESDIKIIECAIKEIASSCSSLAFAYLSDKDIFLVEGWTIVLKNPEFEEKEFLDDFLLQFDFLEERIKEDLSEFEDFDICIGKEKSLIDFDNLALMVFKNVPLNAYLGILGPSRMPYDKNINLILNYEYRKTKRRN